MLSLSGPDVDCLPDFTEAFIAGRQHIPCALANVRDVLLAGRFHEQLPVGGLAGIIILAR